MLSYPSVIISYPLFCPQACSASSFFSFSVDTLLLISPKRKYIYIDITRELPHILTINPSHSLLSISLVASSQHILLYPPFFRFLNISFSCSDFETFSLCSFMILTSMFKSRPSLRTLVYHLSHWHPSLNV